MFTATATAANDASSQPAANDAAQAAGRAPARVSAAMMLVREGRAQFVARCAGDNAVREADHPEADAHLFTYERPGASAPFFAAIYRGRQGRTKLFHCFRSEAARAAWIERTIADFAERCARNALPEGWKSGLCVGTILSSVWGYGQTNVDFFEVVALRGKASAVIRPIGSTRTYEGDMHGKKSPKPGQFTGPERIVRIKASREGREVREWVRVESYAIACPWDGKPAHFSEHA